MSDAIRTAIDRLRAYPGFKEHPQFKWSSADIEKFQTHTGLTIPSQLAELMTTYGNFGPEAELYFSAKFDDGTEEEEAQIQILINQPDQVLDFQDTFGPNDDYAGRINHKYIFFGTADGGNSFILADGTRGDSPIYYWQLAFDPLGEGDNARGVAIAADSLADFIRGLRTFEEL